MAKLAREEVKIMRRNISKKTMLRGAALLSMLTKVVYNPVFLAYLTNRPYEVLSEYHYTATGKNETVLADSFIPRL
jgi:hypothetical protein